MNRAGNPSRCGIALLVVLACLVVTVPVCLGLAQYTTTTRTQQKLAQWTMIADDLRHAAEVGPIRNWLLEKADTITLPVDNTTPFIEILHDRWMVQMTGNGHDRAVEYELHIAVWDQCGMVPLDLARAGSPLRLALPESIRQTLDNAASTTQTQGVRISGLDMLYPSGSQLTEIRHGVQSVSIFPSVSDGTSNHALGAFVATHQTGRSGRININTAPISLVESALRMAGRGGIEQIIEARAGGQRAIIPTASRRHDELAQTAPQIASTSTCWAFRIETRTGSIRRSWWVIYQQTSSSNQWECVQRLVIPD